MINNQTPQSNTSEIFAQFKNNIWSKPMKPVSNNTNTNVLQNLQNSEKKVEVQPKTSTVEQDTFVKKDKKNDKKKIAKYIAIGTGVAAIAYSAFALIKYRKGHLSIGEKLVEPIKTIAARINPNGFKPKKNIETEELDYVVEVYTHVKRLSKKQQQNYIQNLYQNSNFSNSAQELFKTHFNKYFNN